MTSNSYIGQFPFDKARQFRILLYSECDGRGRRLLFDSDALQEIPIKKVEDEISYTLNNRQISCTRSETLRKKLNSKINCKSKRILYYKHSDAGIGAVAKIGEMVYGTLPLSLCGPVFKVHWLGDPSRMLCSQVFLTPVTSCVKGAKATVSMSNLLSRRDYASKRCNSIDRTCIGVPSTPLLSSGDRRDDLVPSKQNVQLISPYSDDSCLSILYFTESASDHLDILRSEDWCLSSLRDSTQSSLVSVSIHQSDGPNKLSTDGSSTSSSCLYSDSSLQHRISRNLYTSLENGNSSGDLVGFVSDIWSTRTTFSSSECLDKSRCSASRGDDGHEKSRSMIRRVKLALVVCIAMSPPYEQQMQIFCSEHIAILEAMLFRLRAKTERACGNRKRFLRVMVNAWRETGQWMYDLFCAPRINSPAWFSITMGDGKRAKTAEEQFVRELCWLIALADTKETNFFVSTVLTAVLTHHLGWVSTLSLANHHHPRIYPEGLSDDILSDLSGKHPYNALWAQLSDLYGAIGAPPKLCRTIVSGRHTRAVQTLLNVLSYFIRCAVVRRHEAEQKEINAELLTSTVGMHTDAVQMSNGVNVDSELKRSRTYKESLSNVRDVHVDRSKENDDNMLEDMLSVQHNGNCRYNITTQLCLNSIVEDVVDDAMEADEISPISGNTFWKIVLSRMKYAFEWIRSNINRIDCQLMDLNNNAIVEIATEQKCIQCSKDPTFYRGCIEEGNVGAKAMQKNIKVIRDDFQISPDGDKNVFFILGDNEPLINLRNQTPSEHRSAEPINEQLDSLLLINSDSKPKDEVKSYSKFTTNYIKSSLLNWFKIGERTSSCASSSMRLIDKKDSHTHKPQCCNNERETLQAGGDATASCPLTYNAVNLLNVPLPATKHVPCTAGYYASVGFVPSLFLDISDHYVADMVLQGTTAPPNEWTVKLRQDIVVAAHSASLSMPVANVAIIADLESWDVRIMSSQAPRHLHGDNLNVTVGMSSLVSSMVETLQVMNNIGADPHECLSFVESKLQEIYLQSETIATFLLETDFCSLSTLTSALNLSENDVPLLLAVATVHTPILSNKCGISFR